jgi:hypothetical protein
MAFDSHADEAEFWIKHYSSYNDEQLFEFRRTLKNQQKVISGILIRRGFVLSQPIEIVPKLIEPKLEMPGDSTVISWIDSEYFIHCIGITVVLGVIWTTVETYFAYKNISKEEWEQADGFAKKSALIAAKTGSAMASRPGQVVNCIRAILDKSRSEHQSKAENTKSHEG